ncbi:MAG TPA: ROK family protein [Polyangiaceae bacterium]|nr:ROK family protein [Polyangiaceae bacterium]
MPIPYKSRPRPEPRISTCNALLRQREAGGSQRTLCIDIGGTGIKMIVLDPEGQPVNERARELTPKPATPEAMLDVMRGMLLKQPRFDRVSVGFPGVVRHGTTYSAANVDSTWIGFDLGAKLEALTGKPTRVLNDADLQGYGVIEGKGVEMVLTLGTGVGSALFVNGHLVPNLELGHHPFQKDKTYEERLSDAELKEHGKQKWSKRVGEMLQVLSAIFNYDHLYIGGGNAEHIKVDLPDNVTIFDNVDGMTGGIALWDDEG